MVSETYGLNNSCQTQALGLNPIPKTMLEHTAQINIGPMIELKPPILVAYASGSHITKPTCMKPNIRDKTLNRVLSIG